MGCDPFIDCLKDNYGIDMPSDVILSEISIIKEYLPEIEKKYNDPENFYVSEHFDRKNFLKLNEYYDSLKFKKNIGEKIYFFQNIKNHNYCDLSNNFKMVGFSGMYFVYKVFRFFKELEKNEGLKISNRTLNLNENKEDSLKIYSGSLVLNRENKIYFLGGADGILNKSFFSKFNKSYNDIPLEVSINSFNKIDDEKDEIIINLNKINNLLGIEIDNANVYNDSDNNEIKSIVFNLKKEGQFFNVYSKEILK